MDDKALDEEPAERRRPSAPRRGSGRSPAPERTVGPQSGQARRSPRTQMGGRVHWFEVR